MSVAPGRRPDRARREFISVNGSGPWKCYHSECGKQVTQLGRSTWDGNIHHLDGDYTNDVAVNLVVMHAICHQRYHGAPSVDERRRISEKLKGRRSPTKDMKFPNHWSKTTDTSGERNNFYGMTHDAETLTKMRRPRRRVTCEDCGGDFALNWRERHKREGKCIRR